MLNIFEDFKAHQGIPTGTKILISLTGTFNMYEGIATEGNCTNCPSGKFCNETGLAWPAGECFAGYLCIEGATHPGPNDGINGPCPRGHYCELGK